MKESWYLIRYNYGCAAQAISNLERNGVICYSPKISDFKTCCNNASQKKDIHLFPPYLFINFNPNNIPLEKIKYSRGVNGFVRFGHEIKVVPDSIMNILLNINGQCSDKVADMIREILKTRDSKVRVSLFLSFLERAKS